MVQDGSVVQPASPQRPFRLQAAWFLHPHFLALVQKCWADDHQLDVVSKLQFLKQSCSLWNRRVFGNIFYRKSRCLARLQGIQVAMQDRPSMRLQLLETSLQTELNAILTQEEVYWRQISRVSWLKEGERNTRFFHLSTLIRRRQNHVTRLRLEGGD